MIRRDYILRMIEEFIRALARIVSLKKGKRWEEAAVALDVEFKKLIDAGAESVVRLSETELLARVINGEPTQTVRDKTFVLISLLSEAGEVAAAQGRNEESNEYYLKALHLVLEMLQRGDISETPEFVPKVEGLVLALRSIQLPAHSRAMLMQHYERLGEFAKAEDEMFALFESNPSREGWAEFGAAFYQRLLAQSDDALLAGNLPRAEVEEGLRELQKRAGKSNSLPPRGSISA